MCNGVNEMSYSTFSMLATLLNIFINFHIHFLYIYIYIFLIFVKHRVKFIEFTILNYKNTITSTKLHNFEYKYNTLKIQYTYAIYQDSICFFILNG